MAKYNGHRNWNHWNVSLWIGNDEGLYLMAKGLLKLREGSDAAARRMLERLTEMGVTKTPDGAPYTYTTIRAALRGLS